MTKRIALVNIVITLALVSVTSAFAKQWITQAKDATTEISIEHTPCYGPCPEYKLTLLRDGTETFVGVRNVGKIGTYTATVGGFNQLARAVKQHSFQRFHPDYTSGVTDLPHTITSVVQSGHRKTVESDIVGESQALWEIQTLIDGMAAEAAWKKTSTSTKYR